MYILENYVRESRTQCLADMYPASRVSYDLPSRKIEGDSARRVDDMSSLTNALFLLLHIWKEVPLGVYRWTHALKRGQGGGELPCFAHSVCAILHGISLWDLQS